MAINFSFQRNPLRRARCFLALLALGALTWPSSAQVPQLIQYQGRVLSNGTNFDGAGQFKFALVNSNGLASFWSNDGNSANGGQPAYALPLTVTKGLYAVLLGDTGLGTNMTAIPATVFTNSDVRLRTWFNDGASGFQLLTPDQRMAPVGYAMIAANVPDGAITANKISAGAIGTVQLAPNAVTAGKVAGGAVFPYHFAGGRYVPSGGMILSANADDGNLLAAGYIKVRKVELPGGSTMYLFLKP